MARTGGFTHVARYVTSRAGVGMAYDAAKKHTLALRVAVPSAPALRRDGQMGALYVYCSAIAGGATTLTCKVTRDAAGDQAIVPSTTATWDVGVATATDGSVVYSVKIPLVLLTSDECYVFFKVDAGTVTIDESALVWQE